MTEPRECVMDGEIHVTGDCCVAHRACRRCGSILHYQPIYGGYMETCESCPEDQKYWEPRGTNTSEDGENPAPAGSFR